MRLRSHSRSVEIRSTPIACCSPWRGVVLLATVLLAAVGCGRGGASSVVEESAAAIVGRSVAATGTTLEPAERPKNVILLLGDGMGIAHVTAARLLSSGLEQPLRMEQLPVLGMQRTHAANALVTDSAASASAIATESKVDLGAISQGPSGTELPTLAERVLADGRPVGVITDSYLWDASPAAFLAHAAKRREYADIVGDMASSEAALLIGNAMEPDPARYLEDDAALGALEQAGRRTYRQLSDVELSDPQPFAVLQPWDDPVDLAAATELALTRLAQAGSGFFLFVETEQTDTESHANNLAGVVEGVLDLDRALEVALSFAETHGNTVVVVTADHECGGLNLTGGKAGEPLKVEWASVGHTASPVPVFALGPGAETFDGNYDNTALGSKLAALLGLTPL